VAVNVTLREAARLLRVSEKTLYRWIQKGVLPAYRVHDAYRFNRVELEEWAVAHRRPLPPASRRGVVDPNGSPTSGGHRAGGTYYRWAAARDQVFESLVALPGIPRHINSAHLWRCFCREGLASTAVAAVSPSRIRETLWCSEDEPTVLLCFRARGDFGAPTASG
jgi:PTS system nitrogen regulatory IIA component